MNRLISSVSLCHEYLKNTLYDVLISIVFLLDFLAVGGLDVVLMMDHWNGY